MVQVAIFSSTCNHDESFIMPIQILPPQLANQIAAGEVVERPSSVIKELLENSLDAGSTRIEIDIERGGSQLIRIRDNGMGINKDELALALSRHATSKVSCLDDLEAIASLGFRGEALASISSVSRLTMTSRTEQQTEAWSARAEGIDMAVEVKPAAHPIGTSVEVCDLFFNTPARRRFLRTDKTEFSHIDEVVRRIALSRNDVQIKLTHNGKLIKHYRAAQDNQSRLSRIATVFGNSFIENCIELSGEYADLRITGWLGQPEVARAQSDLQYCYVNARMMKDKLINHAIRQAFSDKLDTDLYPAYLIYIEVDPRQVDVNVHPAKHEVRFHQARLVHDYIFQAINGALEQNLFNRTQVAEVDSKRYQFTQASEQSTKTEQKNTTEATTEEIKLSPFAGLDNDINHQQAEKPAATSPTLANTASSYELFPGQSRPSAFTQQAAIRHSAATAVSRQQVVAQQTAYAELTAPNPTEVEKPVAQDVTELAKQNQAKRNAQVRLLSEVSDDYLVFQLEDELYLLSKRHFYQQLLVKKLAYVWAQPSQKSQPLLLPVALKADTDFVQGWQSVAKLLEKLAIDIHNPRPDTLVVRKVPACLRETDLASLIPELIGVLSQTDWNLQTFPQSQVLQVIERLDRLQPNWLWADWVNSCSEWRNLAGETLAELLSRLAIPMQTSQLIAGAK